MMTTHVATRALARLVLVIAVMCPAAFNAVAQSSTGDDLSLESLLDVTVSTAATYEQTAREAPASVTVISSEDIERYGYGTLADVLQNVRGFYVSYDRNYAYAGVRGFSRPSDYNNRLLVLVDGKPTNESVFGSSAIGTDLAISLESLERIEIIRGPGSALYGTSAMFAVINLIPKSGRDIDGFQVVGKAGSFGQREASLAVGHLSPGGLEVMASGMWGDIDGQDLYFPEFDDEASNNGMAVGQDWDQFYSGWLRFKYSDFTLSLRHVSREKGIPTGAYETAFNAPSWTRDNQSSAELRFERPIAANLNLSLRGHASRFNYIGLYPYADEGEVYDSFEDGDAIWLGSSGQLQWDSSPANRVVGGVELTHNLTVPYNFYDDFDTYSKFDEPFSTVSVFVQDEYELAQSLQVTAGLRYDHYTNSTDALSPRAAILYLPNESSVFKLLYGTAFRAPSAFERLYEDELGGWKPNPGLSPEHITTIELVWEQQLTERLHSAVSAYQFRVRDLVDTTVDPADSLIMFTNLGAAAARGIEGSLNARLQSGASAYASYGFQRTEDTDTDLDLSNSPRHLAKFGLHFPFANVLWAAPQVRCESSRKTVYDTETEPFWMADLNVGTKPLFGGLQVRFRLRNLFDQTYASPGGFEHSQPSLLQDGRSLRFELKYSF